MVKKVSLIDKIGYSFGNLGYGSISQYISTYLVFYASSVLMIPGHIVGIIVALSVIWDAITDPTMGYISDNSTSRFGKRHFYIGLGTVFSAAFNLILWNIPIGSSDFVKSLIILFSVLMIKTFTTAFITPFTALGAELSDDYDDRSMIQAVKTVFFLTSIVFVSALSLPLFFKSSAQYPIGQLNPESYGDFASFTSFIMLVTGSITLFTTKKYITFNEVKKDKENLLTYFKIMITQMGESFKNFNFRMLVLGYLFMNISSAIITTMGLHVYTYTFSLEGNQISMAMGTQFIVAILAQPIWAKISIKLDKKNTVKLGLGITLATSTFLFLLVILRNTPLFNMYSLFAYSAFGGFGIGGLFSIPLSMVADTVDEEEIKYGRRNEGVYYGLLTFAYKISQSIAIFTLGYLLTLSGFDPLKTVQTENTELMLGLFISIGTFVAFYFSRKYFSRYTLNKEIVEKIQEQLEIKRVQKRNAEI
jgi:Na+/melibiose symporter-like transporter